MLPPATKKRKTNRGRAIPVGGAPPTNHIERPSFSIEIIAKIASFASYSNGDVFNLCVAVGPTDARLLRHVCLTGNSHYLWRVTKKNLLAPADLKAARAELTAWMELNPGWRERCKPELVHSDWWSSPRIFMDGQDKVKANPIVLFNNPAAAIELGMVDILKHLVETIGIDVNSYRWGGYTDRTKYHLLYKAATQEDRACFDYLASRPDINVCSAINKEDARPVWQLIFLWKESSSIKPFHAMITRPSFDPHEKFWDHQQMKWYLPIQFACSACLALTGSEHTSQRLAKIQMLLDVGADPLRSTPELSSAFGRTRYYANTDGNATAMGRMGKKLIEMMEKKGVGMAAYKSRHASTYTEYPYQ